MIKEESLRGKYRGCLLGLAVGDALGAPVEFLSLPEIKQRYGEEGISDYDFWGVFHRGAFTDDTQLSLATAKGCIQAFQNYQRSGHCSFSSIIYKNYQEWLKSQEQKSQNRFPGSTCLLALKNGVMGSIEFPVTESKGSGGVMRTAPVGLAFPSEMAFREGAEYAALTHGHPSGYLPAGFLAELIARLVEEQSLEDSIKECLARLMTYEGNKETTNKVEQAVDLSQRGGQILEAIEFIGKGWVGEDALALAIFCSLVFQDSYKDGVLAAVNHSGDSDTVGCLTGAILGTLLGDRAIPSRWVLQLEDSLKIKKIADDMFRLFQKGEIVFNLGY
ncbi:MAG: ADP-ribosylglycohydrolase family protein [Acidobacteriota bacterium]